MLPLSLYVYLSVCLPLSLPSQGRIYEFFDRGGGCSGQEFFDRGGGNFHIYIYTDKHATTKNKPWGVLTPLTPPPPLGSASAAPVPVPVSLSLVGCIVCLSVCLSVCFSLSLSLSLSLSFFFSLFLSLSLSLSLGPIPDFLRCPNTIQCYSSFDPPYPHQQEADPVRESILGRVRQRKPRTNNSCMHAT